MQVSQGDTGTMVKIFQPFNTAKWAEIKSLSSRLVSMLRNYVGGDITRNVKALEGEKLTDELEWLKSLHLHISLQMSKSS